VASKLDWNEEALGSTFYKGLKDSVKDEMKDLPDTYKKLVTVAIKINTRQWERRLEKGGKYG
jgi:hypothetical protein